MNEKEQLIFLNSQMSHCIASVKRIEAALIGDEFNPEGIVQKQDKMDKKLKRLDNMFYMLVGALTLGTYPMYVKWLGPVIKNYLDKN